MGGTKWRTRYRCELPIGIDIECVNTARWPAGIEQIAGAVDVDPGGSARSKRKWRIGNRQQAPISLNCENRHLTQLKERSRKEFAVGTYLHARHGPARKNRTSHHGKRACRGVNAENRNLPAKTRAARIEKLRVRRSRQRNAGIYRIVESVCSEWRSAYGGQSPRAGINGKSTDAIAGSIRSIKEIASNNNAVRRVETSAVARTVRRKRRTRNRTHGAVRVRRICRSEERRVGKE